MCKCTPMIKTPYCGKGECQIPTHVKKYINTLVATEVESTNVQDIIEDIQQAQIDAGGRFMRQREIANMTVGDLLKLLIPNNVKFDIYHTNSSPFHDKGDLANG